MDRGETDPGERRSSLVLLLGALSAANLVSMLLRLVGGLVTARFVVPEHLGEFNGIGLVLTYAPVVQLGIVNGLNRELPFRLGRGERREALELASSTLGWTLLCGSGSAAAALVFGGWQALSGDLRAAAGWAAFGVALFCHFPNQYLQSTMRTGAEFARLAKAQLVSSVVYFALIGLVALLGFQGLCLRLVLGTLVEVGLLWYWRPLRVRPALRAPAIRTLIAVGLPIFVTGYAYAAWRGLDSFLVLHLLGDRSLGLFQISSMTLAAGGILSQTTAQVLYPRMSREFGRTGDAGAALRLAARPLLALALLGLPVVALGWALLPPFVGWLLPRYLPGVQAAQWSLLSVYLLYLTPTLNLYPVTGRLSAYLAVVLLSAGAFLAAVPWRLAASPGDPLAGMAQAMAAGVAVFAGAGNVGALLLARWGRPVPGPRA